MPATDSPSLIVARFLKANHYYGTLEAFLKEAGLPEAAALTGPDDWTLEEILEEKKQYDASLLFEKKSNDQNLRWSEPAPSTAVEPDFIINSNVLCVSGGLDSLIVSTADRQWTKLHSLRPFASSGFINNDHGSPILSMQLLATGYVLSTSMSGQLMLHHLQSGRLLGKCRHHLKYTVHVAYEVLDDSLVIATAGWDQKIYIYSIGSEIVDDSHLSTRLNDGDSDSERFFGDPIYTIELSSNPESILFVRHPDTSDLYLVLARRDSTHLYYYRISKIQHPSTLSLETSFTVTHTGRQNLAPHSNAWVAFSPSCLSKCPKDPTLLAVATSNLPHMKLILVRLLFPSETDREARDSGQPLTQASQARAALAVQDREEAAVVLHVSTMAPQTPYSTPQVVWRPDASGVWVNGDDGVIRGIEARTGKVVALLKGHEPASKVRTLWAGHIPRESASNETSAVEEVLMSGGFDKKAFIWLPEAK